MQTTILITGGAGYIGSHVVKALQRKGYRVLVIDNLVYGHRDIVEEVLQAELIVGDIRDRTLLDRIFTTYSVAAVMHFAAYAYVGESVLRPDKYYCNNVAGTLTLLEAMMAAGVKKLVFSSTCATYGIPEQIPIAEEQPQNPINPYGISKLMVEQILADFETAFGLKSVIFRYFNAAGADPEGLLGEDHTPETHLLPLVLLTALGRRDSISVFGTDYSTPDGTCIRDYIHVADIAQAHILGLEHLLQRGRSEVFNLSSNDGFSVWQIIEAARAISGQLIKAIPCARRPGDPPILVGNSTKVRSSLGWQPQYPDIREMMLHAWKWHQKRHGPVEVAATTHSN
ncbi:MAG: UDP-glucose 4-epimerase GalE [Cyanophyceae cyanobacterium]